MLKHIRCNLKVEQIKFSVLWAGVKCLYVEMLTYGLEEWSIFVSFEVLDNLLLNCLEVIWRQEKRI